MSNLFMNGLHFRGKNIALKVSLICWMIFSIFLALNRSLWDDEIFRLRQSYLPLIEGIQSLWAEPSPFTPGEIVLNWIARIIFSEFFPVEFWTRIPGIVFGVATIWVGHSIGKVEPRAKYLWFFLALSISLAMLSVQMRPYGSLIFCGAVATRILINGKLANSRFFTLSAIFFGHIYGVCYICAALFFRKSFFLLFVGIFFVILSLMMVDIAPIQDSFAAPSWKDILSTILFVLGNPKFSSYSFIFLFITGIYCNLANKTNYGIIWVLLFSTLGPVLVILATGYVFAARQFAGGIVPFLFFCSFGLVKIEEILNARFKNKISILFFLAITLSSTSIYPWIATFVLNHQRPLVDQPIHRFKEIGRYILANKLKQIVILNPCQIGPMLYYVGDVHLKGLSNRGSIELAGVPFYSYGPYFGVTFYTPASPLFCKANVGNENNPANSPLIERILAQEEFKYDVLVYDQVTLQKKILGTKTFRAW